MKKVCWPYFDPEFCNLPERIHGPSCRVVVDNERMEDCTVVKVDGVNKQDVLLEVVQVLTDLNLRIVKGYISSDAGWFMDVFHVKDEHGRKIREEWVINYIQQGISSENTTATNDVINNNTTSSLDSCSPSSLPSPRTRAEKLLRLRSSQQQKQHQNLVRSPSSDHTTAIQMTGSDRPGLFSEISAALADLGCNVEEAHAWSHNARLACVVYISEAQASSTLPQQKQKQKQKARPITDPARLAMIEERLTRVLRGTASASTSTSTSPGGDGGGRKDEEAKAVDVGGEGGMVSDVERRLHQLMLSVRDFDVDVAASTNTSTLSCRAGGGLFFKPSSSPRSPLDDHQYGSGGGGIGIRSSGSVRVWVDSCRDKGYSIVSVSCKDRPRLMFDTVCTLIDLQYVIFHASVNSNHHYAFQEYFIRHVDGCPLNTQSEKDRVTKCLEAALERRVCEGVKVELCANNRLGLLSDITRVLRENGLSVVRADVATKGEEAHNAFYVRDMSGRTHVGMEFVESVKKEMGEEASPIISLQVKNEAASSSSSSSSSSYSYSYSSFGGTSYSSSSSSSSSSEYCSSSCVSPSSTPDQRHHRFSLGDIIGRISHSFKH